MYASLIPGAYYIASINSCLVSIINPLRIARARFTLFGSVCLSDCPGNISFYVCSHEPAGYGAYRLYNDKYTMFKMCGFH